MALVGTFAAEIRPAAWFANDAVPGGFFSSDAIGLGGALTPRRAIWFDGVILREVTDALVGTGKKPVVMDSGVRKERTLSEGVPVILVDGRLRCLDLATESLVV